MSLITLDFFQVLCHQLPYTLQQCVHIFLSLSFVADIPLWKPFLLTFMSLDRLHFRWTLAFLALSLHANTVCLYFCVTWHQFHLLYASFFFFFVLNFVRSSVSPCRPPHLFTCLPVHGDGPFLRSEYVALENQPALLLPSTFFQVYIPQYILNKHILNKPKSVLLKDKAVILLFALYSPFRILNTTTSHSMQPRLLPRPITFLNNFFLFVRNMSSRASPSHWLLDHFC